MKIVYEEVMIVPQMKVSDVESQDVFKSLFFFQLDFMFYLRGQVGGHNVVQELLSVEPELLRLGGLFH